MEHNRPSLADALDQLIGCSLQHIIVVPYFLDFGFHVAEGVPALVASARARHPTATILLAEHLAYDRHLLAIIADRVAAALAQPDPAS